MYNLYFKWKTPYFTSLIPFLKYFISLNLKYNLYFKFHYTGITYTLS